MGEDEYMLENYLKENNLIICPNYLKKEIVNIINNNHKLINFKVMDLIGFKNNYLYTYNKKTIYYLMKKLNIKAEVAIEYLETCYYIENKEYKIDKLNKLVEIKNELIEKNLLEFNTNFSYYLKNTNIIIYGYNKIEPFYLNIFNKYQNINYLYQNNNKKEHDIYEFDNIEDEIYYVAQLIKNNLDNGVSINKIKLINPSDEYIEPLRRIFNWCHLPLTIEDKIAIYNIPIGKKILEKVKNNNSFDEIINSLSDTSNTILNQIISIFNEYIDIDTEPYNLYDLIEYDLKNTYLSIPLVENCIKCVPIETLTKDDYSYLLGFNKENYPIISKDEEFLTDNMKIELGLFTSDELNMNSIQSLRNNLNQDTNLFISYKFKTFFDSYNPSILIEEDKLNVIKNNKIDYKISHFQNKIILAEKYDDYYKYGIHSRTLDLLRFNYSDIGYRSYNNQFTGIKHEEFIKNLKNPLTVSYSSIDEYYRCSFRYYISNILTVKQENNDEFYQNIGTIFHYVLSKCFNFDFDFDKEWNEITSKYEFTLSKMILLDKLKKELKYDIKILKKQLTYSYFNQFLYEKKFSLVINNKYNFPVNFVGIVDKISYLKEENRTLITITDYKTGNLPTNLNNIIYGIGMQLPIYLYFARRSNLFPNMEIVGFYLQKIINKEIKVDKNKTFDEEKEKALKLVGYSTDNEEILGKFDFTYQDSVMISNLKKKKEGFYAYSKILNNKQIEKIDNIVDTNINKAVSNILDAKFDINPKRVDKEIIGCEYCDYRDICYKKEADIIELEKHQHLDFLNE